MDTAELELANLMVATEEVEPYVLAWPLGATIDGDAECTVLVLRKRPGGLLIAMPVEFLPEAMVAAGNLGGEETIFGPSFTCRVPAIVLDNGAIATTGTDVDVRVVDCLVDVVHSIRNFEAGEEIAYGFDADHPYALPSVDMLMALVVQWAEGLTAQRMAFYTPAEEGATPVLSSGPETPEAAAVLPIAAKPKTRKPGASRPSGGGDGGQDQKPKKVTTASLAAGLDSLMSTLPTLTNQVAALAQKQEAIEARMTSGYAQSNPLLSQPLGGSLALTAPSVATAAKELSMPPRTQHRLGLGMLASPTLQTPAEVAELEKEKLGGQIQSIPTSGDALAAAVLAQSKALTTLVGQIASASSDPMAELTQASGAGTRGAAGRNRLQAELASHRGSFFQSVTASMARRMMPTSSPDATPMELLSRGVSGVQYLERFGGYGRNRELGQLQYQAMTMFDFLMADNIPAAKDTLALMVVAIEQMNLDGGRSDLATLLCLQEDPPSSIFVNRHLSTTSRARAFAPLADQRWITTCALAYLKELEVISAKRLELGSAKTFPHSDPPDPSPKPKAKANPKRRGKFPQKPPQEEEE